MGNVIRNFIITIIQWQARMIIKRYKPQVVAVTGSVGKTGTKDAIYTVLSRFFHTRKSKKSFNSEVGIPLTIIGCPTGWRDMIKWVRNILKGFWVLFVPLRKYPKCLVLEVGVGKPGDMEELKQWVQPDVVVVSAFGEMPSHVEFFDSKEEVWKEEASIIDALKSNGVLVLNHDDERVYALKETTNQRVITFGFSKDADISIQNQEITYKDGMPTGFTLRIEYEGKSLPVTFPGVIGGSFSYYAGAAMAVAYAYDVNMLKAVSALGASDFPQGRAMLVPGKHGSVIIDDTYNSSPPALGLALDTLEQVEAPGRKIAVLGDMLELGRFSDEEHHKLGLRAVLVADVLVTVGVRARGFADAADEAGFSRANVYEFDEAREAGIFLQSLVREGDIVLVKGSQGVRMERTVFEIMNNKEKAGELLCRQEKEWVEKV